MKRKPRHDPRAGPPEPKVRKKPKLRDKEQNRVWCKIYMDRLKADPVKWAARQAKKKQQSRDAYQRLKSNTELYAAKMARYHQIARKRKGIERPLVKNVPGRAINSMTVEERRAYRKIVIAREMAREHAYTKKLDVYAVYQMWGCSLPRDYPGMRNHYATKHKQTKRTPEKTT